MNEEYRLYMYHAEHLSNNYQENKEEFENPFCDKCNTVKDMDGNCPCSDEQLNLFI